MLIYFQKTIKLFIIFFAVIIGWTSLVLLSDSTFKSEIKELIKNMYVNQKKFVFDIKNLSVLLVKDANERLPMNNQANFVFNDSDNNLK